MMKQEFEALAGYEVSFDDYTKIIEPMYMAVSLSKQEFVKVIDRKRFEVKREAKHIYKMMGTRNYVGEAKTPNGCYYYGEPVELIEVRISDRKYIVKALDDKQYKEAIETLGYHGGFDGLCFMKPDMDYTDCIDSKTKKPVELHWNF